MKGLMVVVAILAAVSLACCKPKNTEWMRVDKNPSIDLYVEKNSVKRLPGNIVRAWFTYIFIEPKEAGPKFIAKGLTYDEVDCDKKTLQIMQVTFFFTDGTSQSLTKKLSAADIKPGSMSELEYSYLCRGSR